jgi:protein-tyrosine phosphatase
MGRTGTVLAGNLNLKMIGYLIYLGMECNKAIVKLRKERKGSIQTYKQEDFLKEYEKSLVQSKNSN